MDVHPDPALETAYVSGQARPDWPVRIGQFITRSQDIAKRSDLKLDLPYGPHERQRFDRMPAQGVARATLIYLHPGYWQMRDKSQFLFLGETFARLGCDILFANYPLAPESSVAAIIQAAKALVPVALEGRALPIIVAGHSAGAHLAVELALTNPAEWGLKSSPIAGVAALSGVYDLEPLVNTSLNRNLRLTPDEARAASPVHRVWSGLCPALFAVGGGETPAFLAQNADMHAAWHTKGNDAMSLISGQDDHFSLLESLEDVSTPLYRAVDTLMKKALGAS